MIVVAIIGILAAIAIPKFAELIRKSQEGKLKGNLGSIRSALNIYYADMEGTYPYNLYALTVSGKYLSAIPRVQAPSYHTDSSIIRHNWTHNAFGCSGNMLDSGELGYWNDYGSGCITPVHVLGEIWVTCTHTDTKGSHWSSY